eukprot:scaffold4264_cov116-Isochrysis_galbana.AAC.2
MDERLTVRHLALILALEEVREQDETLRGSIGGEVARSTKRNRKHRGTVIYSLVRVQLVVEMGSCIGLEGRLELLEEVRVGIGGSDDQFRVQLKLERPEHSELGPGVGHLAEPESCLVKESDAQRLRTGRRALRHRPLCVRAMVSGRTVPASGTQRKESVRCSPPLFRAPRPRPWLFAGGRLWRPRFPALAVCANGT